MRLALQFIKENKENEANTEWTPEQQSHFLRT